MWSRGKGNPLRLVKTVVVRKSAVQPSAFFEFNMPNSTTNPVKIPTSSKEREPK
jgi:hypothetical protein